jgi:hypothetical protein
MTIFLTYYAAAFVVLYVELRRRRRAAPGVRREGAGRSGPEAAWWPVAGIVVAYLLQRGIVTYAATVILPPEPWRSALPIGVAAHGAAHPDVTAVAWLLLGLVQTALLWRLYRAAAPRGWIIAGCIALAIASLTAPSFISPDPYAYVADAALGRNAYAPPAQPLGGDLFVVNKFFGTPLLPAPYGPLWIAIVAAVTAPAHGLLGKLVALRLLGAASLMALLAALRAAGVPARLLAVAALDPALWSNFVADAHNDLIGIDAIVAAAALLRFAGGSISCALIVVASAIKLPFAVLALPVLAPVSSRQRRAVMGGIVLAASVALSWWGAGAAYFHGLFVHVPAPGPVYALNLAVTVTALAALLVAAAGGPRFRSAVWFIGFMSSYIATWYLAYALPYALGRRRILAYLLIALPFACALADAKFMRVWTYAAVVPLGVAAYAVWALSRPSRIAAR